MATTLRPFRDYDEKDVINLFALEQGAGVPVTKGHFVTISGDGWKSSDELQMLGDVGASFNNTVSQRYGVAAKVAIAGTGDNPLGMMLYDCKETDENGEQLKFNPRKAAEMEVALSGQAVPVVTRGIFLYSGSVLKGQTATAGQKLYVYANGGLTTGLAANQISVGRTLGTEDSDGVVLVKIEL